MYNICHNKQLYIFNMIQGIKQLYNEIYSTMLSFCQKNWRWWKRLKKNMSITWVKICSYLIILLIYKSNFNDLFVFLSILHNFHISITVKILKIDCGKSYLDIWFQYIFHSFYLIRKMIILFTLIIDILNILKIAKNTCGIYIFLYIFQTIFKI